MSSVMFQLARRSVLAYCNVSVRSGSPFVALRSDQPNRRVEAVIAFPESWKFWQRFQPDTVAIPQCGDGSTDDAPQCGGSPVQLAEEAANAVERALKRAAEASKCGEPRWRADPKDLALKFRRCLQAQPDLIGWWIRGHWVRSTYPLLCQAERVIMPPPYKDFAEQLALLIPRKRKEIWSKGKRIDTFTAYHIPDPDAAVSELAAIQRKRA